jgi:hypothetical protein
MINNSWLDNWGSGLLLTILNLCGGISKHGTMASLLSDACFIANIFINNYCARLKFWHRDSVLVVPVVQVLELAVETFRCLIINASEIRVATVS